MGGRHATHFLHQCYRSTDTTQDYFIHTGSFLKSTPLSGVNCQFVVNCFRLKSRPGGPEHLRFKIKILGAWFWVGPRVLDEVFFFPPHIFFLYKEKHVTGVL